MKATTDLRVGEFSLLTPPEDLIDELPISPKAAETVVEGREAIENILTKKDSRMLAIVGPCSIHDEKAVSEYATKLSAVAEQVKDTLCIIMRVYFEKPRTTIGWKGLINDPFMDGSNDIQTGLKKAREILLKVNELGLPAATEMLDPIIPQYIAGLISWSAIGARTTESQTHREMASGLSMPVGFKNGTDGGLDVAINAMKAGQAPQSFLGIDPKGRTCVVNTTGNPWCHIVLRGGERPNYDPVSVDIARQRLKDEKLPDGIIIDCSHDNSGKKHQGQSFVWKNVIDQRLEGNDSLVGMMLESNLFEGNQKSNGDPADLKYGVSITDECVSWETTEKLLLYADERLKTAIN